MKRRKVRIEVDADVLLYDSMIQTVTLHGPDGTILTCRVRNPIDDPKKYEGTKPYQWIVPQDHAKVRAAIVAALKGKVVTTRYMLRPELYSGKGWCVETEWSPSGAVDRPVLGVSFTFTAALAKLTAKERELVKLLGDPERSAALHAKKSTTLRSAKSRLSRKLGISATHLAAFCAAYSDLV